MIIIEYGGEHGINWDDVLPSDKVIEKLTDLIIDNSSIKTGLAKKHFDYTVRQGDDKFYFDVAIISNSKYIDFFKKIFPNLINLENGYVKPTDNMTLDMFPNYIFNNLYSVKENIELNKPGVVVLPFPLGSYFKFKENNFSEYFFDGISKFRNGLQIVSTIPDSEGAFSVESAVRNVNFRNLDSFLSDSQPSFSMGNGDGVGVQIYSNPIIDFEFRGQFIGTMESVLGSASVEGIVLENRINFFSRYDRNWNYSFMDGIENEYNFEKINKDTYVNKDNLVLKVFQP